MQAGGQRFESVILHFVTAVPLTVIVYWLTVIVTSFFDILTHKTVSKDFKFDILTHKTVSKDFKLRN